MSIKQAPFWSNYASVTPEHIKGFFGNYRFLSNFHECDVMWNGYLFPSSEHAYQFAKVFRYENSEAIHDTYLDLKKLTPSQAKTWGNTRPFVNIETWDRIKTSVMFAIVLDKFMRNSELKNALVELRHQYLEETNHWKDEYWGVNYETGKGKNELGYILMMVANLLGEQK